MAFVSYLFCFSFCVLMTCDERISDTLCADRRMMPATIRICEEIMSGFLFASPDFKAQAEIGVKATKPRNR
jgi:hypothetical protein